MTPWEAFCNTFRAEHGVDVSVPTIDDLTCVWLTDHFAGRVADARYIEDMSRNASAAGCIITAAICHIDKRNQITKDDVNHFLYHHFEVWHEEIVPVAESERRRSTASLAWKKGN